MDENSIASFKEKLEKEYNWPALYIFKFIVPKGKEEEIKNLFIHHEVSEKASSKGNYVSITSKVMVQSSEKVIEYYLAANKVEGVIAL